jgi:hypothetical protein
VPIYSRVDEEKSTSKWIRGYLLALGNLVNISYMALVPHFAMPVKVTHPETGFGFKNQI